MNVPKYIKTRQLRFWPSYANEAVESRQEAL